MSETILDKFNKVALFPVEQILTNSEKQTVLENIGIGNVPNDIDVLRTGIDTNSQLISDSKTDISDIKSDIEKINETLNNSGSFDVDEVLDRVSGVEEEIVTVSNSVAYMAQDIERLDNTISIDISQKISDVEASISEIDAKSIGLGDVINAPQAIIDGDNLDTSYINKVYLDTILTDVYSEISTLSSIDAIQFKETLPDEGSENILYLIVESGGIYQYVWEINVDNEEYEWHQIGFISTDISFDDFYMKTDVDKFISSLNESITTIEDTYATNDNVDAINLAIGDISKLENGGEDIVSAINAVAEVNNSYVYKLEIDENGDPVSPTVEEVKYMITLFESGNDVCVEFDFDVNVTATMTATFTISNNGIIFDTFVFEQILYLIFSYNGEDVTTDFNVVSIDNGVTDHSKLTNLDYDNSGHTGFVSSDDLVGAVEGLEEKIVASGNVNVYTLIDETLSVTDYNAILDDLSNGRVSMIYFENAYMLQIVRGNSDSNYLKTIPIQVGSELVTLSFDYNSESNTVTTNENSYNFSDYQEKTDADLETESKEIVGAINEVKGSVDGIKEVKVFELEMDNGPMMTSDMYNEIMREFKANETPCYFRWEDEGQPYQGSIIFADAINTTLYGVVTFCGDIIYCAWKQVGSQEYTDLTAESYDLNDIGNIGENVKLYELETDTETQLPIMTLDVFNEIMDNSESAIVSILRATILGGAVSIVASTVGTYSIVGAITANNGDSEITLSSVNFTKADDTVTTTINMVDVGSGGASGYVYELQFDDEDDFIAPTVAEVDNMIALFESGSNVNVKFSAGDDIYVTMTAVYAASGQGILFSAFIFNTSITLMFAYSDDTIEVTLSEEEISGGSGDSNVNVYNLGRDTDTGEFTFSVADYNAVLDDLANGRTSMIYLDFSSMGQDVQYMWQVGVGGTEYGGFETLPIFMSGEQTIAFFMSYDEDTNSVICSTMELDLSDLNANVITQGQGSGTASISTDYVISKLSNDENSNGWYPSNGTFGVGLQLTTAGGTITTPNIDIEFYWGGSFGTQSTTIPSTFYYYSDLGELKSVSALLTLTCEVTATTKSATASIDLGVLQGTVTISSAMMSISTKIYAD